MRKATVLTIIFGLVVFATAGFYFEGIPKIPKGITKWKLKNTNGMEKMFDQIKDMGLSRNQVEKATKLGMAMTKPGAIALTVENNAPFYTISFAGITATFENGVMTPYELFSKNGMGVCNIDEHKIKCRNTLGNGYKSQIEVIFKKNDTEVTLIRITDGVKVNLDLVRM